MKRGNTTLIKNCLFKMSFKMVPLKLLHKILTPSNTGVGDEVKLLILFTQIVQHFDRTRHILITFPLV